MMRRIGTLALGLGIFLVACEKAESTTGERAAAEHSPTEGAVEHSLTESSASTSKLNLQAKSKGNGSPPNSETGSGLSEALSVSSQGKHASPQGRQSAPQGRQFALQERQSLCAQLPIFNVYRQAGALLEQSLEHVVLSLPVDLHSADCGAPDCYGHRMKLRLQLQEVGGSCRIKDARAQAKSYGCDEAGEAEKEWSDHFLPSDIYDLADPLLHDIELRDLKSEHALVLLRSHYYFFEGADREKVLVRALAVGDEPANEVYGYASARALIEWRSYYDPPYEFTGSFDKDPGAPEALAKFNRWSTGAELRDNLGELVFRVFSDAPTDIRLLGGLPATTALVRGRIDAQSSEGKERELLLKFSRKPCATCATGVSGWWLYSAEKM